MLIKPVGKSSNEHLLSLQFAREGCHERHATLIVLAPHQLEPLVNLQDAAIFSVERSSSPRFSRQLENHRLSFNASTQQHMRTRQPFFAKVMRACSSHPYQIALDLDQATNALTRHVVDVICPPRPERLLELVPDPPELYGLDEHPLFRPGEFRPED